MWSAVTADSQPTNVTEYTAQLQLENATLRELLSAGRHSLVSPVCSQGAQTDTTLSDDSDINASVESCGSTNIGNVVDSTVIEVSQHEPSPAVTATLPQTDSIETDSSHVDVEASSVSDVVTDSVTQQET